MLDAYVSVLEKYLGVSKTEFSFVERWSESPPVEAKGRSLSEFLGQVYVLRNITLALLCLTAAEHIPAVLL